MSHDTTVITAVIVSHRAGRRRRAGLSLIELVLALAITGMLLTATMVALDASFKAYATAATEASSQAQTRMVTHRLLKMIRTGEAVGPLRANPGQGIEQDGVNRLTSPRLEFYMLGNENKITIEYDADSRQLLYMEHNAAGSQVVAPTPFMDDVAFAQFTLSLRKDSQGLDAVARATMRLQVRQLATRDASADDDDRRAFYLENDMGVIEVVASTMPRTVD